MSVAPDKSVDLHKLLAKAQLPALSHSAIQIMDLARNPENGPAQITVPIEADPGLTGQVLRFVNSSYFGFSNEISSVRQAVTLVGIRTIKNFTLWTAVFSLMPNPRCGPFDLKSLWADSLRRGLFARQLSNLLGRKEAEEAFAAGLLQDMAVPLLARELSADYVELLKERDGGQRRLSDMEQQRFGWNHAQAAGLMARQWRLPDEFRSLIEGHIKFDPAAAYEPTAVLQTAVSLSSMLPSSSDTAWYDLPVFEQYYEKLPLNNGPTLVELLGKIDEKFADFAPVLKVAAPGKKLVDFYNESIAASTDGQ